MEKEKDCCTSNNPVQNEDDHTTDSSGNVIDPLICNCAKKKRRELVAELLKCSVCKGIPSSPLHTCEIGHIVCGICIGKVRKCGECQGYLQTSGLAERLAKEARLLVRCPNKGCSKPIKFTDGMDHSKLCYFREIHCQESYVNDCQSTSIPFHEFPAHLLEKHSSTKTEGPHCSYSIKFDLQGIQMTLDNFHLGKPTTPLSPLGDTSKFPVLMIDYDGKIFLWRWHWNNWELGIYSWVCILGDKEQADKYSYDVRVRGNNMLTNWWRLPVLPYHDYSSFVKPQPLFSVFPKSILLALATPIKNDEKRGKVEWELDIHRSR